MTLRNQLDAIASRLANDIVAAIQGASLLELVASSGGEVGNGRARRPAADAGNQADHAVSKKTITPGRLPRRSPAEIAKMLDKIVLLVKTHRDGMRAEAIRSTLGMQAKEMPRILREGLATNKLTCKGNKRATTYFAKI
jgi:hypothetical protein